MPEQNKEKRLSGEAIETTSSDSFVTRRIDQLRQEIQGTLGAVIDIESPEVLTPKIIASTTAESISDIRTDAGEITDANSLSAQDSRYGLAVRRRRLARQQEKKAA